MTTMFASLSSRGTDSLLTPGMLAVTYAAMTGILVVTIAYATVGLLLALRPGGGRMGAILLVGSAVFAAVPFGYAFAGTVAIRNPLDPVANVLVLLGPGARPARIRLDPPASWRWCSPTDGSHRAGGAGPLERPSGALAAATILIAVHARRDPEHRALEPDRDRRPARLGLGPRRATCRRWRAS